MHSGQGGGGWGVHTLLSAERENREGFASCFCLPCHIPPTSVMTRQLPHLPNLTPELHSWHADIYDLQAKKSIDVQMTY